MKEGKGVGLAGMERRGRSFGYKVGDGTLESGRRGRQERRSAEGAEGAKGEEGRTDLQLDAR